MSLFWQHHALAPEEIELAVVIPTFKRPKHLQATLNSVVAQALQSPFAVIVMDSHPKAAEGAAVAQQLLTEHDISATVILAHRHGNCAAYNAGFYTALTTYPNAKWIQIIDDDEIARPGWLAQQVATLEKLNADFCGAPQHPVFDGGHHQNFQRHPVFEPSFGTTGIMQILYSSSNVLLSAERLRDHQHPWWDEGSTSLVVATVIFSPLPKTRCRICLVRRSWRR